MKPETFRHALLDPDVAKKRILGDIPGVRVDADHLLRAARQHEPVERLDLDAYVASIGGQRLNQSVLNGLLHLLRVLLRQDRPAARGSVYWLPMPVYQKVRTSRRRTQT